MIRNKKEPLVSFFQRCLKIVEKKFKQGDVINMSPITLSAFVISNHEFNIDNVSDLPMDDDGIVRILYKGLMFTTDTTEEFTIDLTDGDIMRINNEKHT